MRDYNIKLDDYGISKWEYLELKAFCRQYDDKRRKAADILSLHSQDLSGVPHSTISGNPTEMAAIRRSIILDDVLDIEAAAGHVGNGRWFKVLIDSCCRAVPYNLLDKNKMPSSSRQAFFQARREFFWMLKQLRDLRHQFGTRGAL